MSTARKSYGTVPSNVYTGSWIHAVRFLRSKIPTQEGYQAYGGYFREEAILALRRFYITSNAKG